ncbi:Zn-dependent exopeptidase [Xylariaceae sp. FL0255]|nr:Zn-dependent exopeptidase [Xylariaceae sp. FL0255]
MSERNRKMADERTPFITTVAVGTPRPRYTHHIIRRFCTIACISSLIALFITFIAVTFFTPTDHHHDGHPHRGHRKHFKYEKLQEILLDTPDASKASEWSKYYTAGPHLAGKNLSQAEWTRDHWNTWGVNASIVAYDTYINYPAGHRLALLEKSNHSSNHDSEAWKVVFEATLVEDVLEDDPTTQLEDSVPTFHGYSASGDVTGSFVYVNYGSFWDFLDLVNADVDLKGKIAIARYGGVFRGLKVKRAQEMGMIGVLLFDDPGNDGEITEENGWPPYPEGPARNPSSVQRGSVQFLSFGPGDPSTPGYPSKPGVPREPVDETTPSIPSLPVSYAEVIPILKALNGHGPKAEDMNEHWTESTGLKYKGVDYNIGPSPDNVVLNLVNEQNYTITPMWDVIGIINGTIPDEVIIVGNHRDAWIAGGAGDPNSGSAVINEVIRSFGKALEQGWKPLRTIVFASWDGEEYGLVGSTEWVEEYLPWISATNVAYINVDVAFSGPELRVSAAPLLYGLVKEATALVQSPNQTVKGQTVYDAWNKHISTMGSGSDFTAFQDYAGVPSLDIGFARTPRSAVYHYHSNYDSYAWMSGFGDPGFVHHKAMAQVLGLLTAKISEAPLVAFNATDYAVALHQYVGKIEEKLANSATGTPSSVDSSAFRATTKVEVKGDETAFKLSLDRLYDSVKEMRTAAETLDAKAAKLATEANEHIPWWHWIKKLKLIHHIRFLNNKYKTIERAFLYSEGLDSRPWFKHVVFAPGIWTGYAGAVFPGLVESIDNKDFTNALKWANIIDTCIKTATETMQ